MSTLHKSFGEELKARIYLPFKPLNILFFAHFIFFTIIIGGLGIWVSAYEAMSVTDTNGGLKVAESMATFFMAAISSSFIQINFSGRNLYTKSFLLYSFILFILCCAAFYFAFSIGSNWAFLPGGFGYLLALFVWYVAYCDDPIFKEGEKEFTKAETTGHVTDSYGNELENVDL